MLWTRYWLQLKTRPWAAAVRLKQLSCSTASGGEGPGAQGKGKEVSAATSSLRIDAVAASGLDISRKGIWEACLDGLVYLNGEPIKKKSASVKEGDIIEVDTVLEEKDASAGDGSGGQGTLIKRGRVIITEIGPRTKKGGYRLTLMRHKQFALFRRKFSSYAFILCNSLPK